MYLFSGDCRVDKGAPYHCPPCRLKAFQQVVDTAYAAEGRQNPFYGKGLSWKSVHGKAMNPSTPLKSCSRPKDNVSLMSDAPKTQPSVKVSKCMGVGLFNL